MMIHRNHSEYARLLRQNKAIHEIFIKHVSLLFNIFVGNTRFLFQIHSAF